MHPRDEACGCGGDVGVSVAISSHPTGEFDGRNIERQAFIFAKLCFHFKVQLLQERRGSIPQDRFNNGQAAPGFVDRCRLEPLFKCNYALIYVFVCEFMRSYLNLPSDLVRGPNGGDFSLKVFLQHRTFVQE